MRRSPLVAALVALSALLAAGRLWGQSPAPVDVAAVDALVAGSVAAYRIPGLSLALVEGGKLVFAKGYGEASRGRAASADTAYYLGSTSKMFTALAVLRLAAEGRVELDAPYKRYVRDFALGAPGAAERITVRQLLNQTSGLSDRGAAGDSAGGPSLEAELGRLAGVVPLAEPGTAFRYYNVNYRLLALLVERVSGEPFGDYVEREVFSSLGMSSSLARDPRKSGLAESLARGHGSFLGLSFERGQEYRPSALASGMMISSARDIGSFLEAELAVGSGGVARGPLDEGSLAASWTPPAGVRWPAESLGPGGRYGMGWMVVDDGKGGSFLFHGGALESFQSAFYLDPARGRGFAILMNQGGMAAQSSLGALRDGLLALFEGSSPRAPRPRPAALLLGLLFFLGLGYAVLRLLRLRTWLQRIARRLASAPNPAAARGRALAGAAAELGFALFLAFGLLPLGNALKGDYVDWALLYGLAPDAVWALFLAAASSCAAAAAKLAFLARRARA